MPINDIIAAVMAAAYSKKWWARGLRIFFFIWVFMAFFHWSEFEFHQYVHAYLLAHPDKVTTGSVR
jgi:hypothetical protein